MTDPAFDALISYGLSSQEAIVYLELTKLGQTAAGPLVRRCRMHRQTVYNALDSLGRSNLVSFVNKNNRRYFLAADPEDILAAEASRYGALRDAVPAIKALRPRAKGGVEIQVFEGRDELYNCLISTVDSAARGDGIVRILGGGRATDFYEALGANYLRYVKYAFAKGIRKRLIAAPDSTVDYRSSFLQEKRTELRIFPTGLTAPTYTRVTREFTDTIVFADVVLTIRIWSRAVARGHIEHFDLLWRQAKKVKRRA